MAGTILYITFDGVLQPLGFSQVARVVARLGQRGLSYHLLSLERPQDLANSSHVAAVRKVLADAGVDWTTVGVKVGGSAVRSGESLLRMLASATGITRRHRISLVHARGYQAAGIARALPRAGIPYIFDARGYWIDERREWFSGPWSYAGGKLVERSLYRDAAAVVTLTELHATDIRELRGGNGQAVFAIPTCADYDEFRLATGRPVRPKQAPSNVNVDHLRDKVVLGIVGSLNRSYMIRETLELTKHVLELSGDAHLLVLTAQKHEYSASLANAGVSERATIVAATHEEMPQWMRWIDWGVLLLVDILAKRGSMPTKLAEFFASGVRPIAYGCNGEMIDWVRRAGSGLVLEDTGPASLREAARRLLSTPLAVVEDLARARAITSPHFSLSAGIERYERMLRSLV